MSFTSFIRWDRPEVKEEAPDPRRSFRMKDRTTWQDILEGVGKVEMDLRKAHIALQEQQDREIAGKITVTFVIDRNGTRPIDTHASPEVAPIEDTVCRAILDAPYPPCRQAMRVCVTCNLDLRVAAKNDPFDDPFAADYGTPQTRGSDFGDPF